MSWAQIPNPTLSAVGGGGGAAPEHVPWPVCGLLIIICKIGGNNNTASVVDRITAPQDVHVLILGPFSMSP